MLPGLPEQREVGFPLRDGLGKSLLKTLGNEASCVDVVQGLCDFDNLDRKRNLDWFVTPSLKMNGRGGFLVEIIRGKWLDVEFRERQNAWEPMRYRHGHITILRGHVRRDFQSLGVSNVQNMSTIFASIAWLARCRLLDNDP